MPPPEAQGSAALRLIAARDIGAWSGALNRADYVSRCRMFVLLVVPGLICVEMSVNSGHADGGALFAVTCCWSG